MSQDYEKYEHDKLLTYYLRYYSQLSDEKLPDVFKRKTFVSRAQPATTSYEVSYNAVMLAIKKTGSTKTKFAELAKDLFLNMRWQSSYGGPAWAEIAEGYLMLNRAKSYNQMQIAIDHAFDLQHNTGTVLNKSKIFAVNNNFAWLEKALDLKRDVKSIYPLLKFCSSDMKKLALESLKVAGFVNPENKQKLLLDPRQQRNEEIEANRVYNVIAYGFLFFIPTTTDIISSGAFGKIIYVYDLKKFEKFKATTQGSSAKIGDADTPYLVFLEDIWDFHNKEEKIKYLDLKNFVDKGSQSLKVGKKYTLGVGGGIYQLIALYPVLLPDSNAINYIHATLKSDSGEVITTDVSNGFLVSVDEEDKNQDSKNPISQKAIDLIVPNTIVDVKIGGFLFRVLAVDTYRAYGKAMGTVDFIYNLRKFEKFQVISSNHKLNIGDKETIYLEYLRNIDPNTVKATDAEKNILKVGNEYHIVDKGIAGQLVSITPNDNYKTNVTTVGVKVTKVTDPKLQKNFIPDLQFGKILFFYENMLSMSESNDIKKKSNDIKKKNKILPGTFFDVPSMFSEIFTNKNNMQYTDYYNHLNEIALVNKNFGHSDEKLNAIRNAIKSKLDSPEAKHVKPNATITLVKPTNGKKFELAELKMYVGGEMEIKPVGDWLMIYDATVDSNNSHVNSLGTSLNKRYYEDKQIYGDILLCKPRQIKTKY